MSSAVDICNIALGHLGDSANVSSIDPPEGSAQAEHCARFYPMARDTMLEMHDWGFATRRAALAQISIPSATPATAWEYAYAVPSTAAKLIAILVPETPDSDGEAFDVETLSTGSRVIYTNVEDAILRYVERISDTTKFSPLFVDALGWLLASYLAGPIIKGDSGATTGRECYKTFLGQYSLAVGSDTRQRRVVDSHVPASIRARGVNTTRSNAMRVRR
jgi:hypothetical protein